MEQTFISEFQMTIRRHLGESRGRRRETKYRTASTPGTSAKLAFEGVQTNYLDALHDLDKKISGRPACVSAQELGLTDVMMTGCREVNGPRRKQQLDSLALLSPALLWMVPAFCFCPHFLDPLDAEERCIAIQDTRTAQEDSFTDDIWDKDSIHGWAGSDDSRLLLLQGSSRTTRRFERFVVEIVHAFRVFQLSQTVRLVYILNTGHSSGASSQVGPLDVLQQVAVQCLQYVRPREPVSFLIAISSRFKRAATTQAWFGVLQDICVWIPSLYIIIDLAILGRNHEEAESWPARFQEMFNYLKETTMRCRLKVMLLCCQNFVAEVGETLVINAPPSRLAFPERHEIRKQLDKIVADPERTSFNQIGEVEAVSVPQVPHLNTRSQPPLETFSVQTPSITLTRPSQINHHDTGLSSPSEPRQRSDFKIAIMCALTLESDAVQDVFDRRWDEAKYGKTVGDPNQYTTGVIGRHNVVVVHMPGMGKSNGASAAANCRASFTSLGLVLVVGICGGVPFPSNGFEIVLGDIIISDGLTQYDFGRQFPDRFVRRNDTIARPNSEVLSFLAKMKGRWNRKRLRERTAIHLEQLRNATESSAIADYPGASRDKLYEPTYRHKHHAASTCEVCNSCQTRNDRVCGPALTSDCESLQCDDNYLVARRRLAVLVDESENGKTNAEPLIHFGLYASGDKVMKSGEDREAIAKEEGVIAFEMEGAGVWERFPGSCLVIKAVCDYADSHKNKRWQDYAAASAAACTKSLLESWPPYSEEN